MLPKDLTPTQAKHWVKHERLKHTTIASIKARIDSEYVFQAQAAAPDFAAISAQFPNSNQAHRDLIAALQTDLQALEAGV